MGSSDKIRFFFEDEAIDKDGVYSQSSSFVLSSSFEEGLVVWVGWFAVCWTGWLVCGNCDPLPWNQSHITADFVGKGHSQ